MKNLLALVFTGCLFTSCVPTTPQARIQQDPGRFASLSSDEKALVERGEIGRGMSRDAVLLSWGTPSSRFEGSRDGRPTERWDYTGSRPIYTHQFYGGIGYGRFGGYRGRYHPYSPLSASIGPEITYVPYRLATVWFIDGRVDSWESARRN